jgi:hypothetical protein
MKTKVLTLLTGLLFCSGALLAQVSNYAFTQTLSTYGAANNGSLVGMPMQDDDVTPVNLPFPFSFNGITYTTINVCSNGYLSFNTLSGFEYTALSDLGTQNVIAPFSQDIFMGTVILADLSLGSNTLTNCSSVAGFSIGDVLLDWSGDFGTVNPTITAISGNNIVVNVNATASVPQLDVFGFNGYIKQNLSGSAPNQICEFEFANFTRYGVYDEIINFKVRLYQAGNKIEFVYGSYSVGQDNFPSEVGLKGNSNSDFNSREVGLTNTWSTSTAATLITDVCAFETGKIPTSGQSYMWAATSCTPPVVTITASSASVCAGGSVSLTATGATSYTWSSGSTTSVSVVTPSSSSTYTLISGNTATCLGTSTVGVLVVALPVLTITPASATICAGASITIVASGAQTYSWNTGATSATLFVSPASTTTYSLVGTNNNCSSNGLVTVVSSTCTGLNETTNEFSKHLVYPNPFVSDFTVENPSKAPSSIYVYDGLGRLVYEGVAFANSTLQVPTAEFESGVYILRIQSEFGTESRKLIKE